MAKDSTFVTQSSGKIAILLAKVNEAKALANSISHEFIEMGEMTYLADVSWNDFDFDDIDFENAMTVLAAFGTVLDRETVTGTSDAKALYTIRA